MLQMLQEVMLFIFTYYENFNKNFIAYTMSIIFLKNWILHNIIKISINDINKIKYFYVRKYKVKNL